MMAQTFTVRPLPRQRVRIIYNQEEIAVRVNRKSRATITIEVGRREVNKWSDEPYAIDSQGKKYYD